MDTRIVILVAILALAWGGLGWLVSPSFRRRTLALWSRQREMKTMQDVIGVGITVICVVVLCCMALAVSR
jgi:hypothetical protein